MSTERAVARGDRRHETAGMALAALVVVLAGAVAVTTVRSAPAAAALVTGTVLAESAALAVAGSVRSGSAACVPGADVCVGG